MTWFEAIVESFKFVLAELLAPIFDWLVDAFSDALFGLGVCMIFFTIIFIGMLLTGNSPISLL